MCGIFGIYGQTSPDPALISQMLASLHHRGPDEEGTWSDRGITLGHLRLSIIDLSPKGKQPMTNEDGSLWLTYNGEIYNYLALREELQEKGHVFTSQTDSEVILHAYEEYGVHCLEKFNGMFAFALFDRRTRTLFCARDRFGIKPFYFHHNDQRFIFASEIKALLCDPTIARTANDKLIFDYLTFNRCDFCRETFFKEIYRLLPGHYLLVTEQKTEEHRWWRNDFPQTPISEPEAHHKFFELLQDSVKLRLRSDVPVGSCLSGGLDSSAIVCLIKKIAPEQQLQTFSAVYQQDWRYDEKKYIELLAQAKNLQAFYTKPDASKLLQDLQKLIYHQDEPFGTSAIYAQWEVMKLAQQHGLKVLLDGQGSDEFLAGYLYFFGFYFFELLKKHQYRQFYHQARSYWHNHRSLLAWKTLAFLLSPSWLQSTALSLSHSWLDKDFFRKQQPQSVFQQSFFQASTLNQSLINHFNYKLEHLLRYEDRNSMAFSIESRVPFLDYRLVTFVLSLPAHLKISQGQTKKILRETMQAEVPATILQRQDKIGFATPEEQWFRQPQWQQLIQELITSRSFQERPYFNVRQVKKTYQKFLQGKPTSGQIWKWLNLELWLRRFIDS